MNSENQASLCTAIPRLDSCGPYSVLSTGQERSFAHMIFYCGYRFSTCSLHSAQRTHVTTTSGTPAPLSGADSESGIDTSRPNVLLATAEHALSEFAVELHTVNVTKTKMMFLCAYTDVIEISTASRCATCTYVQRRVEVYIHD